MAAGDAEPGTEVCPAEETLAELTEGLLGLEQAATLHHHLRSCSRCQSLLAALAPQAPASPRAPAEPTGPQGVGAGRYQVLRPVGAGAMGEVFAAFDTQLQRTVALKMLRPAAAEERLRLRERLQREAQAMARLAHPHVVSLYEVGVHQERDYLAMEYVEGGNLQAWLQAQPRTLREVCAAFRDAGEGLAAAHAAGLVHRDFKPENVLVGQDGRVRVTDFGLARPAGAPGGAPAVAGSEPGPSASSLTSTGAVLGTPAYMAPEQRHGAEVDARADQFSFCASLYGALGGALPVRGELARPPALGRGARRLWSALQRGLAPNPADRHPDLRPLLLALGEASALPSRRWLGMAGLLFLLLALSVAGLLHGRPPRPVPGRRTAVVLTVRNATGRPEQDWLAAGLGELLAEQLGRGGALLVEPAEAVSRMESDLGLATAAPPEPEALRRIRAYLGVDLVIAGELREGEAGGLRLDLHLFDAAQATSLAQTSASGEAAHPEALAEQAARAVGSALGVGLPATEAGARTAFPLSAASARSYAEGIARLRTGDAQGARKLLEEAAQAEPHHPRIQAALARALNELGYEQLAQQAAARAVAASGPLEREEQLEIAALAASLQHANDKAAETYRALLTFRPERLEYGLALADVLTEGGHPAQALEVLQELRRRPELASGSPQLDLASARAEQARGEAARALAAARQAKEGARQRGMRRVEAEAILLEGAALFRTGDTAAALAQAQAAVEAARAVGDRAREGQAEALAGMSLADRGQPEAARAHFEAYLAQSQASGRVASEFSALNDLGILLHRSRDLRGARARFEAALELSRRVGPVDPHTLTNLGNVQREAGDLASARRSQEEALALDRAQGNRAEQAQALENLAGVLLQQDQPEAALAAAEEGLTLAGATGARAPAAYLQTLKGQVLLGLGRPAEAEPLLKAAAASLAQVDEPASQAEALAHLVEVEQALHHPDKAREALAGAEQAAGRAGAEAPVVLLALAHLALAQDRKAREPATTLRDAAAHDGYLEDELELSLGLGRAGRDRAGLRALAERASAAGYVRIARLARTSAR